MARRARGWIKAAVIALWAGITIALAGCASDPVDREFRRRVESVQVQAAGEMDGQTKVTRGTVSLGVRFREPGAGEGKQVRALTR